MLSVAIICLCWPKLSLFFACSKAQIWIFKKIKIFTQNKPVRKRFFLHAPHVILIFRFLRFQSFYNFEADWGKFIPCRYLVNCFLFCMWIFHNQVLKSNVACLTFPKQCRNLLLKIIKQSKSNYFMNAVLYTLLKYNNHWRKWNSEII